MSVRNSGWQTLFLRNRHLLVLSIVVALAAGIFGVQSLQRLEDPRIVNRYPIIITAFPGASAERVETLVTEKLEDELAEVSAIKDMTSTSRSGVSVVVIELLESVNKYAYQEVFAEIRDKITEAARRFPDGVATPIFDDKRDPAAFSLILALSWDHASEPKLGILNRLAEDLADRLRTVRGTEMVRRYGAPDEQLSVLVEPRELNALGLDVRILSANTVKIRRKGQVGALVARPHGSTAHEKETELSQDRVFHHASAPMGWGALSAPAFVSGRTATQRRSSMYAAGMKNRAMIEAPVIPPASTIDMDGQKSPPTMTMSGRKPPIVVRVVEITWRVVPMTSSTIASGFPAAVRGFARMAAMTTMLSFRATPIRPNVPMNVLKQIGKSISQVERMAMPTDMMATTPSTEASRTLRKVSMRIATMNTPRMGSGFMRSARVSCSCSTVPPSSRR